MQVIPYWLAQMLGAFVSAVVVYGVYIGKSAIQPTYIVLSLDHPPGLKRGSGFKTSLTIAGTRQNITVVSR